MDYQPTSMMTRLKTWLKCGGLWIALLLGSITGAAAQPASVDQLMTEGTQAGVDPALMEQVVRRAERAGYTADQTAQLLRPAVSLAQEQLPASGVLQKALEGLAKRVPPPRVQPVLQRIQTSTQQAGTLISAWAQQPAARAMMGEGTASLNPAARDQLIQSAAQARMQNVPPDVVQRLLETLPAQTQRRPIPPNEVAAAMQVLPEFMGNGASPQMTIELLTSAVNAGYGPTNVRQLPTAVRAARQQNQRPMDVLVRNAARAIDRGTPAADVLSSLFDGGFPGGPPGDVGPPGNVPGQGKPPDVPPGQGKGPPNQGGGPPNQGGGPPGQGGSGG